MIIKSCIKLSNCKTVNRKHICLIIIARYSFARFMFSEYHHVRYYVSIRSKVVWIPYSSEKSSSVNRACNRIIALTAMNHEKNLPRNTREIGTLPKIKDYPKHSCRRTL